MDSRVSTFLIFSWSMASSEYVLWGPPNTFDVKTRSTKPNEQAKTILKSVLILLKAPQASDNFHRWRIIAFTLQSSPIRISRRICLRTPSVLYRPRIGAGSIGSTFPASGQYLEALRDYFVVFCQLMSGCGWKRWNNEAIHKEWGLVNDYRVRYFYRSPVKVSPAH